MEYLPFQQSTAADGADTAPAVDVLTSFAVKTHGLPYEATKNEIVQFLSNCNVLNGKDGVHILHGPDGRPSGDAIVELETAEDVELALKHHGENMGRRYVEVSQMTAQQVDWELGRQSGAVSLLVVMPYKGSWGGGGGGGGETWDIPPPPRIFTTKLL